MKHLFHRFSDKNRNFKSLIKVLKVWKYFSKLQCNECVCAMVLQIILKIPILPRDNFKNTSI